MEAKLSIADKQAVPRVAALSDIEKHTTATVGAVITRLLDSSLVLIITQLPSTVVAGGEVAKVEPCQWCSTSL